MTQNQIAYQNLLETTRSNKAREYETNRANVTKEQETNRSNLANEKIQTDRNVETNRANVARETEEHRKNTTQEAETKRANLSNENVKYQQLLETHRSNLANESIGRTNAAAMQMRGQAALATAETGRLSQVESARSNVAQEKIAEDTRKQNRDLKSMDQTIAAKKLELEALKSQADIAINQQNANSNALNSISRSFGTFLNKGSEKGATNGKTKK